MNVVSGEFNDVLAVTELRGSYPNVSIAAGVDFQALIENDPTPMFLTLPIGKVGATSGNKRHYDEAFVQELERQTLSEKPIGLMGHLSRAERDTAFPPEAIHWIGAAREGDTLWGKAYVVPGPVRERIARYKAQGKTIATSIDAIAEGVWDEGIKAYRMSAKSLRLNQIDIAPADRAGIPALASVPILTTEMDAPLPEPQQEPEMDKLQVIREMTPEDAALLPEPVRQAVLSNVQVAPEVALVTELRAALGVEADADLKTLITEMRASVETQRTQAVQACITELATTGDKAIKPDTVRGLVVEMVKARQPATVEDAERIYGEVVEMNAVKAALKAAPVAVMGPNLGAPIAPQAGQAKYFVIPEPKGAK